MASKENGSVANPEVETNAPKIKPEAAEKLKAKAGSGTKKTAAKAGKKAAKKAIKKAPKKAAKKAVKSPRPFPIITVEAALKVGQALKEKHGGNPHQGKNIQDLLEIYNTNTLYYLTAASRDYGLTTGTSQSQEIALTPLGRTLFYAGSEQTEKEKKIEAFLNVPLFQQVLVFFKKPELPEMKFLGNILLSEFKLPVEHHEQFVKIFTANCYELDIKSDNPLGNLKNKTSGASIVTVGEPNSDGTDVKKAFIIMPFTEKENKRPQGFFGEVLESLLIPAGKAAGFKVETAKIWGSDVIQSTIINELLEADLVIADLTDHNPNVLFELGLRIAMDKPIALIKSKDTGGIFDVDNVLRIQTYNQNLWASTLKTDIPILSEHIKGAWDKRSDGQTYLKILRRGDSSQI